MGDRRGEGIALSSLGIAYSGMGESRRAIEFFEQAIVIDREMGDHRGEGEDLSNLSMALNEVGERSEAMKYAELALTIFEEIKDPRAAALRAQLADWREPTSN
jgi:tetratricopeptide (TPR) repeat protein